MRDKLLVKIFMKIFQKFFKDNQKLNADEIAIKIENNKFQQLNKYLGDLLDLNTTDKSSLVSAINELLPVVLYETEKVYSSVANDTVITLNDDITNYRRIKVYGISNNGNLTYMELSNPSVNNVFSLNYFSNGNRSGEYAFSTIFRNFIIQSNTQIRYDTGTQLASRITSNNNLHGYVVDVQTIKIYKILGYKN